MDVMEKNHRNGQYKVRKSSLTGHLMQYRMLVRPYSHLETTPLLSNHWKYWKMQEMCENVCLFCSLPKQRSKPSTNVQTLSTGPTFLLTFLLILPIGILRVACRGRSQYPSTGKSYADVQKQHIMKSVV